MFMAALPNELIKTVSKVFSIALEKMSARAKS